MTEYWTAVFVSVPTSVVTTLIVLLWVGLKKKKDSND